MGASGAEIRCTVQPGARALSIAQMCGARAGTRVQMPPGAGPRSFAFHPRSPLTPVRDRGDPSP
ncbi:hypothetical protein LUTEI9C_60009 [Luteimonas sp. 9C]|nr:hypothetical protein LUTEI9C_60009 [Luteimonas sp. 9C]